MREGDQNTTSRIPETNLKLMNDILIAPKNYDQIVEQF